MLYLTLFTPIPQKEAQGINLLYFIACAPASLYSHIRNRFVRIKPALYAAGAGVVTSVLSALFANSIDSSLLRRLFGALMIYAGIKELFYREHDKK